MLFYIGRFQPLHDGHIEIIQELNKIGKFIIVAGSKQEFYTRRNPLDIHQRFESLYAVCKNLENFWGCHLVKDIPGNDKAFVDQFIDLRDDWGRPIREHKVLVVAYRTHDVTTQSYLQNLKQFFDSTLTIESKSTLTATSIRERIYADPSSAQTQAELDIAKNFLKGLIV